jgi:excisionase family DNA binding protein
MSDLTATQLLTAEQLAERWQVPKTHVYNLTRTGQIPKVQLGRYYRYRLTDVEAFEGDGGTASAGKAVDTGVNPR